MNEVEEVAKATQEVAKLATQTGKQAEGVIKTLFGPAANHLGKILGVTGRIEVVKSDGIEVVICDRIATLW